MRLAPYAFALCLSVLTAEIIDRIAITVGERVITESEVIRQARITAFIEGKPADLSSQNKRQVAERLVEQMLIRRELETSRYAAASSEAANAVGQQLLKRYPSRDDYLKALKEYGIAEEDIREALDWQVTLLDFIATRFRPGIQISDAELLDYYQNEVLPKAGEGVQKPDFEDIRPQIESILTNQRVDNALDRWLGQARTQTRIQFRPEVFQ